MKYRVWIRSVPGMYEQYDGYVDVHADDESDAVDNALLTLKTGAFKDRNPGMWKVEDIKCLSI